MLGSWSHWELATTFLSFCSARYMIEMNRFITRLGTNPEEVNKVAALMNPQISIEPSSTSIPLPTFHYDETLSITHLDMTSTPKLVPFVQCIAIKKGLEMIPTMEGDKNMMHLYTLGKSTLITMNS